MNLIINLIITCVCVDMYIVHFTVYSVHFTVYILQCTLYTHSHSSSYMKFIYTRFIYDSLKLSLHLHEDLYNDVYQLLSSPCPRCISFTQCVYQIHMYIKFYQFHCSGCEFLPELDVVELHKIMIW